MTSFNTFFIDILAACLFQCFRKDDSHSLFLIKIFIMALLGPPGILSKGLEELTACLAQTKADIDEKHITDRVSLSKNTIDQDHLANFMTSY